MPRTPRERIDEFRTSGLKATLPRIRVLELFQCEGARHLGAPPC